MVFRSEKSFFKCFSNFSLFFFLMSSMFVQAEVYRWVDSNGEVRFTDRPSPESYSGKEEDRAQKVEVKDAQSVDQSSAGVMDNRRYYRDSNNSRPSYSVKSKAPSSKDNMRESDKQKLEADIWFKEHCAYFAISTQVRFSPRDVGSEAFRKKQGQKLTKAELSRDKRLEKMAEDQAKQNKSLREYAAAKGIGTLNSTAMDITDGKQLKDAYKHHMKTRTRVKSFQLACEDENGETYPEYLQYQAHLNYPEQIDPEAMDQFLVDNPDIRVE